MKTTDVKNGSVIAIIPARFGSTRFPGKPLAGKTGKPLIRHVVEAVRHAKSIDDILVATDDRRIFDAVVGFGARAVMTRKDHPNGTSRIAEAIEGLEVCDIIVNVQGDEPEIEPRLIDDLIAALRAAADAPMATLASPFAEDEDPTDPNIVKVTVDRRSRALYFSRSLIPYHREIPGSRSSTRDYLKHVGLYAYRRDFLLKYVTLPPTPLEEAEKLEQLRALEHGHPIAVLEARVRHHGIDTPQQYEEFVQRYRE